MMSVGVPATVNSPNDTLASYPGTVSAMVGEHLELSVLH